MNLCCSTGKCLSLESGSLVHQRHSSFSAGTLLQLKSSFTFPSLRCMTSPWHCLLWDFLWDADAGLYCLLQVCPPRTPLTSSSPHSGHARFRDFILLDAVTHSCSLGAWFAISIHLLSPHILSQLPDVLIKTVVSSFSLCVGGRRKPPSGCCPGAVTSALCCIEASAHVEWGLVTNIWLSMSLNALGAVALSAWPSSNTRGKHRDRYSRSGTHKGDGDMACCAALLLLGHLLLCIWSFSAEHCHHFQPWCWGVSVGGCKYGQSRPLLPKLMPNARKNALSNNLVWNRGIGLAAKASWQWLFSAEESCIFKLMLQNSATSAETGSFEVNCRFTFCMCKTKVAVSALAPRVFIYICLRTEGRVGTAPKVTGV